ncbi:MAG: hypothetical protein JXA20_01190 [Spirochaetes bacterium]|nr:hypothetical protein [Spirochaetota bacterium]
MTDQMIHALVFVQNWGDSGDLLKILVRDSHVISLFHIMGRHSYLMDTNFDDKPQLSRWIERLKSVKLPSGLPAVQSMQTQRIIDVHKQKDGFSLKDYQEMKARYHFFMKIDNPHHDENLLKLLGKSGIVHSVLHVQGETSFAVEVIVSDYDQYRSLLGEMKRLETIHHIETQEVISVMKYRNQLIDEQDNSLTTGSDIREFYSL